jgi:predicted lipoprotein
MMKNSIKFATLSLTLLFAQSAAAQESSALLTDYLVPAYQQLAAKADAQIDVMEALCQSPSETNLQAARDGFSALVTAYAYAEPVRFGPITQNDRLERLYFWPDRKSTGLKQVQKALVGEDESVLSVESLKDKSVALQGLNALEYVLHGALADKLTSDANSHACRYGETIAQNMWAMADQMVVELVADDGLIAQFENPQESSALFRTEEDVLRISFETFSHFPEIISATRLNEWAEENPNLNVLPLRRAALSMNLVLADIEGLSDAFDAFSEHYDEDDVLAIALNAYRFELNNALRTAKELAEHSNQEILADEALRKKVNYLRLVLHSLRDIANDQIAPELGLVVGFSSLDGD